METSLKGICAMLAEEAIILSTYDDGTGVLTIGAGHTAMAGDPKPVAGMKITLLEALNIFRNDLKKYEREVLNAVSRPLSQNQFDAMVSWHFNTGRVGDSTLTRKLNDGDIAGAAKEFARWNKADGKVLEGLVNRRKRETAIFEAAEYGDPKIRVADTKSAAGKAATTSDILALITGGAASEEDFTTQELLANPESRLLPRFRPRQDDYVTRAAMLKFQDLLPDDRRKDGVYLLAVRGFFTEAMGKGGNNVRGVYDDAIFVIEDDQVYPFNANTDPSVFRKGIAKLKAPQAVRYKPGPHGFKRKGGPYPAFRQNGEFTVIRDDQGEDTGAEFWINLHRGGNTTTSSAGCQTVPPHQWDEFKALVDGLLRKYEQDTFYYVLIDRAGLPSDADIATDPDLKIGGVVVPEPQDRDMVISSIADLQRALEFLGGNVGKIDNTMGPKTKRAIRRFQELSRLPVTGAPTPALMKAVQAVYFALGGK